jgi:hypothetical protein
MCCRAPTMCSCGASTSGLGRQDILIQQGADDVGASVAHFCRQAAIARALLWEARRGYNCSRTLRCRLRGASSFSPSQRSSP